jgi:hypothetical protein
MLCCLQQRANLNSGVEITTSSSLGVGRLKILKICFRTSLGALTITQNLQKYQPPISFQALIAQIGLRDMDLHKIVKIHSKAVKTHSKL